MLTKDDIIDVIIQGLRKPEARKLSPNGPTGRLFLDERELKKRLTGSGGRLTLPRDAIVSPLASDWLTLKGIDIVRE